MDEKEKCPEAEAPDIDHSNKIGAKLDRLEAALEKPLLPLWTRFRALPGTLRFLVSLFLSLLAACLVFLCFLPGLKRTVERNRAEASAAFASVTEPVHEPSQAERIAEAYAISKHNKLTTFLNSEYTIQMRTCSATISCSELSGSYALDETQTGYIFIPERESIAVLLSDLFEMSEPDPVSLKYFNVSKTRDKVFLPPGDEGFLPDIEDAAEQLSKLIEGGNGGTVEVKYLGSAYCESIFEPFSRAYISRYFRDYINDDFSKPSGDSIIEISIDNQYLWLYSNGRLVLETPIVSGDVNTDCDTPKGSYGIVWLDTDLYLKGATWNDFVSFWAPYYGNYGIHDAQWRDEFGGDIYISNGSHGCINVPHEAMQEIFNCMYIKMPIVIY